MTGLGRAIDRGLYVAGQVWEDWFPFALLVVIVAAVFGLAGSIWATVDGYTGHDWHIFGVYALSEFLLVAFAPDKTKTIRDYNGEVLVWTIDAITRHSYIVDLRDRMLGDAFGAALWGGGIGAGLLLGTVLVVRIVDWRKVRQRRRRAAETRGAVARRRPAWLSFRRTLRRVQTSLRSAWNWMALCASVGAAERGNAKPAVGEPRAAEAAAGGLEQKGRTAAAPAVLGGPAIRPSSAARSRNDPGPLFHEAKDDRPIDVPIGNTGARAAPAPADSDATARGDSEHRASENRKDSERGSENKNVSQKCAESAPVSGNRDGASSQEDRLETHDAATRGGGSADASAEARKTEPATGDEAEAHEDGSDDAGSTEPHRARAASDERMPASNERPLGTRLGARRRRRKASQDFY